MVPSVSDAVTALTGELASFLSDPDDPALATQIEVASAEAGTVGIGGYLGLHSDPAAEIWGRKLKAEVVVRVLGDDQAGVRAAEAQVARDLATVDPGLLRRRGLMSLRRLTDRDAPILSADDGMPAAFGREMRYAVAFEHAPLPTASEGVIATVPQDVMLGSGEGRLLYETEFLSPENGGRADPLADFEVFDSPGQGTAGQWTVDPDADELTQTGTRRAGRAGMRNDKGGTFLTLRAPSVGGVPQNFILRGEVRSDGPGGIGFVWRFRDVQNYAFAMLETPGSSRLMAKRVDGSGARLQSGGRDSSRGYRRGEWLRLRLLALDDRFELAFNEEVVLAARDDTLTTSGTVGLFCRANGTARFRHFRLTAL